MWRASITAKSIERFLVSLCLAVGGFAAERPVAIVVDFQSASPARHPCLLATALELARDYPTARVVGTGFPSRSLVWWEEFAPEIRVGELKEPEGLYSLRELCEAAEEDPQSGIVDSGDTVRALRHAFAGMRRFEVVWIRDGQSRLLSLDAEEGPSDLKPLLQKTLALAVTVSAARMPDGCWSGIATREHLALFESREEGLKRRLVLRPGQAQCLLEAGEGAVIRLYEPIANRLEIVRLKQRL